MDFWLKELKENNKIEELYICLVGNKIDLEDKRVINTEEGEKYAKENNIKFFEVSAKSGKGIDELFDEAIKGSLDKILVLNEKEEGDDKIRLSSFLENGEFKQDSKKKCCF